jgi:FtsH-binding integral membrane protein
MTSPSFAQPVAVRSGVERATLVRRTYALVFAGVLLTIAGAAFAFTQPALMNAVNAHPFIAFACVFVPLLIAGRARPQDGTAGAVRSLGLLGLFTFAMGVVVSPAVWYLEQRQPGIAQQAGLITGGAFAVLTAYAFVSRRDFSAWGSFFIVGLWVLIATSLINLFVRNVTADLWLAGATVLVFSGLLIFDTWRLRNVYGPDDYVPAALQIYLDLLNMFLAVIRLLAGGRRN